MPDDVAAFLGTTVVFADASSEELAEIARVCRVERREAGSLILRQGGPGDGVYFLRSGQLVVRVQRGAWRETVSFIQPPNIVGELSFVTGRPCVADVEVVVDAEVVFLPAEAAPPGSALRDAILRGLTKLIAERLQETVLRGARAPESPVVLLHNLPHWEAPWSFAYSLAESLARQTGRSTMLVNLHAAGDGSTKSRGAIHVSDLPISGDPLSLRAEMARRIPEWKGRFDNLILNPVGQRADAAILAIEDFVNFHGDLAGPGDPLPAEGDDRFLVQSNAKPTIPVLSGSRQLIAANAPAEEAWHEGKTLPPGFVRTVDSIARRIAGTQVGLALGGGAAWGWAHIGVIDVLESAGLPIDMISGCSMGSVIGGLRSAGLTVPQMRELALYWKSRTRSFIEWRFWKMCLLNEKVVRKTFRSYFGDRLVNQTEIPYWANAVDIQSGQIYTIKDGSLIDCVRASIALPGLLPPFARAGHLLVDAGISDPVPVELARRMGCHFAIAVNAMAEIDGHPILRRYPFNAFDVMTRCMFVMGHEIGQARAEQASNIVFTPKLDEISMLQFDRSDEIIDRGRIAAQVNLDRILTGYKELRGGRA